jgi:hypothetical protein
MTIEDLLFVGLNSRVAALERVTGRIVWEWRCPKPRSGGVVSLLVDQELLIASVSGYTYGLDPMTGTQLWFNELKGFGTGVAAMATINTSTPHSLLAAIRRKQEEQAAAHGAAGAGAG